MYRYIYISIDTYGSLKIVLSDNICTVHLKNSFKFNTQVFRLKKNTKLWTKINLFLIVYPLRKIRMWSTYVFNVCDGIKKSTSNYGYASLSI